MLAQTELNELSQKVEAISAKGITKKLINSYSILNVANLKKCQNKVLKISRHQTIVSVQH